MGATPSHEDDAAEPESDDDDIIKIPANDSFTVS